MTNLKETTVSSEKKYHGLQIDIRQDSVMLSNGRVHQREVVEHPGGVIIIPMTEDNKVILVRQWRYPVGRELIELPAGKLNPNEDTLEAGKRELEEETGYVASSWEYYGFVYSTPGFCNERLHFYKATGLTKTKTNFDLGEIIEPYIINVDEAKSLIKNGNILDAKTIIGLQMLD